MKQNTVISFMKCGENLEVYVYTLKRLPWAPFTALQTSKC